MVTETLERFERDMERFGFAVAPNGASYKLIVWGSLNIPALERTYQGARDIVVGYSGEQFATRDAARHWASVDGRREYAPGTPLPQRKLLA